MGRVSQFSHLKPEVDRLYGKGKTPADIYDVFENIPPRTLRDWYDYGIKDGRWIVQEVPSLPSMSICSVASTSVCDDTEDIDDYTWAKRETKRLVLEGFSPATKIAAMGVFIQILKLKQPLQVEATVKPDTRDYKDMSTEDLIRIYREKLENDFN